MPAARLGLVEIRTGTPFISLAPIASVKTATAPREMASDANCAP